MNESGYSGTPLARKLGLKAGQAALLLGVPLGLGEITDFAGFSTRESSISRIAGSLTKMRSWNRRPHESAVTSR